jgi:outer membrane protein assembly factor BamB
MPGKQNPLSSALESNFTYAATTPAAIPDKYRAQASKYPFRQAASRLALVILCPLLVALSGCAWPMYRNGATRTGRSAIDTSSNTGTLQWSFNFGLGQNVFPYGPVVGYTSLSGGIFVGDLLGNIYSISKGGTLAWTYSTGAVAATPNAVGIDGSVYAVQSGAGGTLFAVSSAGVPEWTFAPPGGLSTADLAIARDGTIYVGNLCGVLYALNPNGSIKWKYSGFSKDCNLYTPTTSPAVGADGTIYAGVPGVLFALTSGGTFLWDSNAFAGKPAVAPSGLIYVLSEDYLHIYALNSVGVLQWQVTTAFGQEFSLPAIAPDSSFYVGTAGAGLWAVDSTGTVKWQTSPNGQAYFFAPPTIGGDGTIYVAYNSLFAVNPDSTLKWSTPLCKGEEGVVAGSDEPVIGLDGTIYMVLDLYAGDVPPCPLEAFH